MNTTKKITVSAVMIAMAVVLALVSTIIPSLPNGGQITLASMVPIIIVSFMFGTKWGLISSVTYAIIQMIMGFYPPPVQNFISFLLVILLDYIVAFGCLGLANLFEKPIKNKKISYAISGAICVFIRYICHILSGVLIWGVYAPEGQSVWEYSVIYNGSYMIPEIIISAVVIFILFPVLNKRGLIEK